MGELATNQILSVSIQDITAGGATTTADVSGLGWYLAGGQNNILGKALPTDIRLFTGNTDNATGYRSSLTVTPAPSGLLALGLGGLLASRRRRARRHATTALTPHRPAFRAIFHLPRLGATAWALVGESSPAM